jgi:ribonuclease BN (tRNA processing enzyme)
MSVRVRFLGSGDSFGSGGRFQTCILVEGADGRFLFDCGASSLIAMRSQGINPNDISTILLTHLHGDHCAGVPFLLMDAMLGAKRTTSLAVAGPRGVKAHLQRLHEALFPGSDGMRPKFPVEYAELAHDETLVLGDLKITAYPANHTPQTMPLMLRVEAWNKVITYTGDSDWTDALVSAAEGAHLLISECYFFDKPVKMHMNYATFSKNRDRLGAQSVVLTHMSPEMLARLDSVAETCAYDGLVIEL